MSSNLSQLLPSGTYLAFQTMVPLFANNGVCGLPEKIMTGMLILIFMTTVFMLNFVDSITTENGIIYYGIVTPYGLFNPQFKNSNIADDFKPDDNFFTGISDRTTKRYFLKFGDFWNGFLDLFAFSVLSLLAPPITTCYYPGIPNTVVKCAPILAALIVSSFFGFCPRGRKGVGHAVSTSGLEFIPEGKPQVPATASVPGQGTTVISVTETQMLQVTNYPESPARPSALHTPV